MDLEKDWKANPVIRLDMSRGGANAETLRSYLNLRFGYYEEKYAITPDPTAQLADRFDAIITTAYKQTGLKVPSSSTNMTLHSSTLGRPRNTKHAPRYIVKSLPF